MEYNNHFKPGVITRIYYKSNVIAYAKVLTVSPVRLNVELLAISKGSIWHNYFKVGMTLSLHRPFADIIATCIDPDEYRKSVKNGRYWIKK